MWAERLKKTNDEIAALMLGVWGNEFHFLADDAKQAVVEDLEEMVIDEKRDIDNAAEILRKRIGRNNLASYAKCLLVPK